MLHLQAEARYHADPQPESGAIPLEQQEQDVSARGPQKHLEGVGREEAVDDQVDRRDGDRQRSQRLSESPSSQSAGHQAGEEDRPRSGDGGQEAQGEDRIPHKPAIDAEEKGRERWKVNVAESKPFRADQIVELISEVAVS